MEAFSGSGNNMGIIREGDYNPYNNIDYHNSRHHRLQISQKKNPEKNGRSASPGGPA